ncbi:DNA cytosine methyltransferase [Streptomyces sp. CoH17]|uniref:DNA cytosine methyltransferase n=1 Tax=Streptomyces sp. CoH17 TaxID=2992806 RepID=UPI0022701523|nr:DNA cytosine methyltransferase [Streptomyces sp. CoH17]
MLDVKSSSDSTLRVAGLFAGIGGLELGFHALGATTELLCEFWEPARTVLRENFPGVPMHDDVRTLTGLPDVDVVTAGFPCTDLSQAGRQAGIEGENSGLIKHLFDLLSDSSPRWVVIENVRNMLALDKGKAMAYLVSELERLGYRWAYRVVDSRFTGVPQRRQRVLMVASKDDDPADVLLSHDAGEPHEARYSADAFGFYWTEGNTGIGWAEDAIPTLKGGSSMGISSAPAIWIPQQEVGKAIVTPHISDGEVLQGFEAGWTASVNGRVGHRWKLVGNAVTVGVSTWLAEQLVAPQVYDRTGDIDCAGAARWPLAAWGHQGKRWASNVSMWPAHQPYRHLLDVVDVTQAHPLSLRATKGFRSRLEASRLRYSPAFMDALKLHEKHMEAEALVKK